MDEAQYAAATNLCRRMAGRVSDAALDAARVFFAAGEPQLGLSALLAEMLFDDVRITDSEFELIRVLLEVAEIDQSELDATKIIPSVPETSYTFEPGNSSEQLFRAVEVVVQQAKSFAAHRIARVWRNPKPGARNSAAWMFLVNLPRGADELQTYSSISAAITRECGRDWLVEILADGVELPNYQSAALNSSVEVWSAQTR